MRRFQITLDRRSLEVASDQLIANLAVALERFQRYVERTETPGSDCFLVWEESPDRMGLTYHGRYESGTILGTLLEALLHKVASRGLYHAPYNERNLYL